MMGGNKTSSTHLANLCMLLIPSRMMFKKEALMEKDPCYGHVGNKMLRFD